MDVLVCIAWNIEKGKNSVILLSLTNEIGQMWFGMPTDSYSAWVMNSAIT